MWKYHDTKSVLLCLVFAAINVVTTSAARRFQIRTRELSTGPAAGGDQLAIHSNYPELAVKGAPGIDSENFPLDACEGGCFSNSHCEGNLECFFRAGTEPVLGCSGVGAVGMNYCYSPHPTEMPSSSATPVTNAPAPPSTSSPFPSARPTSQPTQQPELSTIPTTSPTATPTLPDLIIVNGNGLLGKCTGNCRNDGDCLPGLRCQERGGSEFVPGCGGAGETGRRYCYDPSNGLAPPSLPSGSFRLRLFWQEGYFWQENVEETFFCMEFRGGGTQPVVNICRSSSTDYEFVYLPGEGDLIRVVGTSQCLDRTGNNNVTHQTCDINRSRQRWKGSWTARRFDIRPIRERDGCLSQHHHPRNNEAVFVNDCERAHLTDTGYWEIF